MGSGTYDFADPLVMMGPQESQLPSPFSHAAAMFSEAYGAPHTHTARAPGRVNLIGEHTDYNDLPVLPIAIQREVRLLIRRREDSLVRVRNVNPKYQPVEFEIGEAIPPSEEGSWANFLKAPAHEMLKLSAIRRGFDAVLVSDIPPAAGLSSSSAIVNAAGLALAHVNEVAWEPIPFATLMAEAEHFTGTRGGGMDQAISLAGRAGHAAQIRFKPLRMRHVAMPEDWRFIVADSGVKAEKSGAAQQKYNQRRSQCEEAFSIVAKDALSSGAAARKLSGYPDMIATMGQLGAMVAGESALRGDLLRRFRHVITEAGRVEAAAGHMLEANIDGFGMLMDASHGSLSVDYQVSTPELDELVAIARAGGAEGARLTGAGLGGCIVALAGAATVEGVMRSLMREYFASRGRMDRIDDHLFVAAPSSGASLVEG